MYRIGAERRSVPPESKPTSVVRIEPRRVPCLGSGHTMNRDDRFGGRSANRAAPAPLPPGNAAIMRQPVTAAPKTATDHFDDDSLEAIRPRLAGLDAHRMQTTAGVRPCGPATPWPLRAAPS